MKLDVVTGETARIRVSHRGSESRSGRQRNPRDQRSPVPGPRARQSILARRRAPGADAQVDLQNRIITGRDRRLRDDAAVRQASSGYPCRSRRRSSSTLLDPAFGLQNRDARAIAEKIEGLAWGPDLPDGRHLLYVISDNDLVPSLSTQIFAFAIDDRKLLVPLNVEPQALPGPLYPPGQLKKQLK